MRFWPCFPGLLDRLYELVKRRQALAGYRRPKRFDANLLVIGAGSAGLVSAYIAATVKAKVMLIEKAQMGGDCLNTGCVPSKALIRAAKSVVEIERAGQFGVDGGAPKVDFAAVMGRVHQVIKQIEPHDSVERFTNLGVDLLGRRGQICQPLGGRGRWPLISAEKIILATGASPIIPPIPGLADIEPSDIGKSLAVANIARESADNRWRGHWLRNGSGFSAPGLSGDIGGAMHQLLSNEDEDLAAGVSDSLAAEGVADNDWPQISVCESEGAERSAVIGAAGNKPVNVEFEHILLAVGRRANTSGFGLQELGVRPQ